MLFDLVHSQVGKALSWVLIVTTQSLVFSFAYADTRFSDSVVDANEYAKDISSANNMPTLNNDGSVSLNGEVIMTGKELTGQQDSDYVPGDTNVYGDDGATLVQGQLAQDTYNKKTLDTADSSGEKAYLIIKDSFSREKPDLTNDPMWENTDEVLANLSEIAEDFANCTVKKQMVSTGKNYHVPKYETCEKLPAIEESFVIGHTYDVGIIRHKSGPLNIRSCGTGCMQVWIGTVGDNYWDGDCTIYEESMSLEVIQPDKISSAKLDRSKFDDYHQVYLNGTKIYNGPNGEFPPEVGRKCELSESWDKRPNVNITSAFKNLEPNGTLNFKTRTSVSGSGEGYSSLLIHYNQNELVYNDLWTTSEYIEKAIAIKKQADDGFCSASITCTNMPTLDSDKCTEINGIRVCENNFKNNPMKQLGISPFCKAVEVKSDCAFNEGELCWTNMDGEEYCFDNDTQERNSCQEFEDSPTCSYMKTECVDGAQGPSGSCYVQEDTYDCGFDAGYGTEVEEETLVCDGQLQCVGESCYSPVRDAANEDFGQVNAYLEMLKYAQSDMTCEGVPEKGYNEQAPPDEYYPVPSCPDGYDYNKEGNVCLKQLTCEFTENDFYSVDLRLGTQVLQQNQIIAENSSVTTCVPVIDGSHAYSCGDLQTKSGTNTFYSLCTNDVAEAVPNSCPTSAHFLKESLGICQVPPYGTCPDGIPLLEGEDLWSVDDDLCKLIKDAEAQCKDNGYSYNGETGQCEYIQKQDPVIRCSEGYTLQNNNVCVATATPTYHCPSPYSYNSATGKCTSSSTVNATPSCPSGYSLSGNVCKKREYLGPQCEWSRNSYTSKIVAKRDGRNYYVSKVEFYKGGLVQTKYLPKGTCSTSASGNYKQKIGDCYNAKYKEVNDYWFNKYYRTGNNGKWQFNICYKKYGWVTRETTPTCQAGYTLNSNRTTCTKTNTTQIEKVTCPAGYEYDSSAKVCYKTQAIIQECPVGWELNDNVCENTLSNEPDYICPEDFEYNPTTKECKFESKPTVTCPSFYPVWSEEEQRCMSESDSPLAAVLDERTFYQNHKHIIDELLNPVGSLLSGVIPAAHADTQTAMNNYAVKGVSEAISESSTSEGAGVENVTCSLFKGEAEECKIAVGGMQNCCKAPVLPNLGDYIKLTTSMIQMDAMTGSMELIEGYSGVWNEASGAVKGLFSSAADTATGTASDAATSGLVDKAAQQVMTYANDWLIDQFGQETAQMFFQETLTSTGASSLAPSAGLAAVGTALMFVYYAYLAYVVFTLLVNIIYECTPEEMNLTMKRELLSTHYLGSYCKTKVLGSCIEKRKSYCMFDSPLSRIMMEQIYMQPQMGLSWGTPKNPNCTGLALTDTAKVDWEKVNIDEWVGILIKSDSFKAATDIDVESLTGAGSYLNSSNTTPRDNAIESTEKRSEGMDADQIRNDSGSEQWNDLQQAD